MVRFVYIPNVVVVDVSTGGGLKLPTCVLGVGFVGGGLGLGLGEDVEVVVFREGSVLVDVLVEGSAC